MATTQLEYMENVARLGQRVRQLFRRRVRLTLDPRVTAVEDPQNPTGVLMAGSSVTHMIALWQSDAEYVDTSRRRERMELDGEPGWLVSFEMGDILDIDSEPA